MRNLQGKRPRRHPLPAMRSLVVVFAVVLAVAATAVHARAEVTDRAVGRTFLTLIAGEEGDKARAAVP